MNCNAMPAVGQVLRSKTFVRRGYRSLQGTHLSTWTIRYRAISMWSACVLLSSVSACSNDSRSDDEARQSVNFYNWYNDLNPTALPEFTKTTGIQVIHDVYDSDEILESKMLVGNSQYDVIVPASGNFARQRAAGLLHELDRSKLHNYRELDPELLSKLDVIDPGNRYGVPYNWGTTGIGYNVELIRKRMSDAPLDSWALIFDPEIAKRFQDCGIAIVDSPGDVVPSALSYLGRNLVSQDPKDLADAMLVVARIQPFVRYFYSSQIADDLATGQICIALSWSGSVLEAQRASDLDLRYAIPKEGALLWFELMAIPADAPNLENAHRLIDFLIDPHVAAGYTNAIFYPSGVASAREFVESSIRELPGVYPPPDVRQRIFTGPPETPEYERQRSRLWAAAKAGRMN